MGYMMPARLEKCGFCGCSRHLHKCSVAGCHREARHTTTPGKRTGHTITWFYCCNHQIFLGRRCTHTPAADPAASESHPESAHRSPRA